VRLLGSDDAAVYHDCLPSDLTRVVLLFFVLISVAARGLDVDDIRIVVNFDFPKEMESYIHRVGRTGRAGKKGLAVSFFVPEKNGRLARELIEILNRSRQVIPPQLQALASFSGGGGGGRGRGGGRRY
jgi:ATP-dependent RNA helicase DDX5/DBP2